MSVRISLDNGPPEFFTNLDTVSGRVVLSLTRPEEVGAVVVKLEGESRTALGVPTADPRYQYPGAQSRRHPPPPLGAAGNIIHENHKVLYRVQQVFPSNDVPAHAVPVRLQPGTHSFRFRFKVPMNNGCGDPHSMSQIGGLVGSGGYGDGPSIFGLGGIRVMDGSRQLMYTHVTKPLPPTFTGLGRQAEIGYYVKVTIQRPGLLKENWRYQINFRFMPLEPPRPPPTGQEAYARRPFSFRPRTPSASPFDTGKRKGLFGSSNSSTSKLSSKGGFASTNPFFNPQPSPTTTGGDPLGSGGSAGGSNLDQPLQIGLPPSVEMSARLPYPSILTLGKLLPLRLISKKLAPSRELVFLTSMHVELIGTTTVRCQDLSNVETTRWVIVSRQNLSIPVTEPDGAVNSEVTVSPSLWKDDPIPGGDGGGQAGLTPSFVTCNLSRTFRLEVKLGLSWGLRETSPKDVQPQAIFLPLIFSSIEVYSGLPLPDLKRASGEGVPMAGPMDAAHSPSLPPRRPTVPGDGPQPGHQHGGQQQSSNQVPVASDDFEPPPPSYEEAMSSKT